MRTRWLGIAGFVPVLAIIAGIELSYATGFEFPVPFLAVCAGVVLAAYAGGLFWGTLAGGFAALLVLHAYMIASGPATLTGSLPTAALGMALYVVTGALLGRLRSRHDAHFAELEVHRERLRRELVDEREQRRRTETDAEVNQNRLQSAVRIAGIGHYAFDGQTGNCEYCSQQHAAHFGLSVAEFFEQTAGYDPALGFVHPDDKAHVRASIAALKRGQPQQIEYRGVRADGTVRHIRELIETEVAADGTVLRHIGTSMDLTDLRLTEARLRESQKLEAIGQLTAGVAHDFNNLLSVILGNLEMLDGTASDAERKEMIAAAVSATSRGSALTSQLLSFGRKAPLRPEDVDLSAALREMSVLLRRTLPANIELTLPGEGAQSPAHVDRGQFEAALLNLVVNAADAMPGGGRLDILVSRERLEDGDIARMGLQLDPADYVATLVRDDGPGIPAEIVGQVFDPFFTTKEIGRGSGLGLSMVLGFARQSGGDVHLASAPGEGTCVTLFLPATCGAPVREAPEDPEVPVADGQEVVLLVEDDPAVRQVMTRQIERLSHRVIAAPDAASALELLERRGDITFVLSDVAMPGPMQGTDLAEAARRLRPSLPVALMSGHHELGGRGAASLADDIPLFVKPLTRAELSGALRGAARQRRRTV